MYLCLNMKGNLVAEQKNMSARDQCVSIQFLNLLSSFLLLRWDNSLDYFLGKTTTKAFCRMNLGMNYAVICFIVARYGAQLTKIK